VLCLGKSFFNVIKENHGLNEDDVIAEHTILTTFNEETEFLSDGCLLCCMIGASNSLETMQLIEVSNQMDYLHFLLDFHDCFPNQMI
jgi:hypothetical protein